MELIDVRNTDSIKERKRRLRRLVNEKLRYYERQLAKSSDPVACDDVDWIELCDDMFMLIEEFRNTIYYE